MSTETDGNPQAPTDAEPGTELATGPKKVRIGRNRTLAILAVHERKQVGYHVDYRSLAPRFNMAATSLRKLYSAWTLGRVELAPDCQPERSKFDDRDLIVRARETARRDLALCLAVYEGAVFTAEDKVGAKAQLGKKRNDERQENVRETLKDLHFVRREVVACLELVEIADEGFDEYLQQQEAEMRRREKAANPANPIPQPVPVEAVRTLSDHERGLEALRAMKGAKHVEVEVMPANG